MTQTRTSDKGQVCWCVEWASVALDLRDEISLRVVRADDTLVDLGFVPLETVTLGTSKVLWVVLVLVVGGLIFCY